VALNVLLAAGLVVQWVRPNTAVAQAAPRPSDYILIPGSVQGNPAQIIYMIDTQNGLLSARSAVNNRMVDMRPLDLNRLFNPKPANGRKAGKGL
jgi:hypothetical protein